MFDIDKIQFEVVNEEVYLHYGEFRVKVSEYAEHFDDFAQELEDHIWEIWQEIEENYLGEH